MSSNDGSESVEQFLARVASIKGIRDDEDAEKSRQMEEEILKSRKERQARRAERARSLSPSKTGPAAMLPRTLDGAQTNLTPPVSFSPHRSPPAIDLEQSSTLASQKNKDDDSAHTVSASIPVDTREPSKSPRSHTPGLARSGTLSWQQRPTSRDGSPRQRPLSGLASVRVSSKQRDGDDQQDATPSRRDISATLSQKDPAWFKQTQDRGIGSAAFRKTQVMDAPTQDHPVRSMQLPGMSDTHSRTHTATAAQKEEVVSLQAPVAQLIGDESGRFRRGNTPDIAALRESMIVPPPKLRPTTPEPITQPNTDNQGNATQPMLARSATVFSRTSRPVSPTKGFGGFVESAMMKRSDSVSKRWNVQANTGLRRGDSVAGIHSPHTRGLSRDVSPSKDGAPSSPLASSRPGSSYEKKASFQPVQTSPTRGAESSTTERDQPVRTDVIPRRSATPDDRPTTPGGETHLAWSPSKTMDSRRWSPTKSTWLESMLSTTTESPKLQPLVEELPKWRVDLQRSKSKRSQVTLVETTSQSANARSADSPALKSHAAYPNASTTSTAGGAKGGSTIETVAAGSTDHAKPNLLQKNDVGDHGLMREEAHHSQTNPSSQPDTEKPLFKTVSAPSITARTAPVSEASTMSSVASTAAAASKILPVKPKPKTPPKTDFRASLRTRATEEAKPAENDVEFKSVFSKLKRATTQNYVAPDVLKDNILSGKAALNVTDGPQRTIHRDEFKESILAKKEQWKAAGTDPPEKRAGTKEKVDAPVPEALQRRKTLSKPNGPIPFKFEPPPKPAPHATTTKPQVRARIVSPKPVVKSLPIGSTSTAQCIQEQAAAPTTSRQEPVKDARIDPLVEAPASTEDTSASRRDKEQMPVGTRSTIGPEINSASPSLSTSQPLTLTRSAAITSSTNTTLASRLNPNLVAMLVRGSGQGPQASRENSSSSLLERTSSTAKSKSNPEENDGLTHMTKGRAKGPKRRAPKAEASQSKSAQAGVHVKAASEAANNAQINTESAQTPDMMSLSNLERSPISVPNTAISSINVNVAPKPLNIRKATSRPLSQRPVRVAHTLEPEQTPSDSNEARRDLPSPTPATPGSKSTVTVKSADTRRISNTLTALDSLHLSPKPSPKLGPKPFLKSSVDKKPNPQEDEAVSQPPNAAALTPSSMQGTPETNTSNSPQWAKVPMQTPTDTSRVASGTGLGLDMKPRTPSKPLVNPRILTPPPDTQRSTCAMLSGEEIRVALEAQLGTIPPDQTKLDFDAESFLIGMKSPETRSRTLQHSISEISGDGRKTAMPPHQDHILHDESMYIISHTFASENGMKCTEVYLWCGDRVSDATIEDVQIFCRKEAREYNAKLEIVKQGAESARLLQALGGIVIIRRSKSASFFMLCGRKHLGHIVFDEVDLAASSLCPGYAYLVSAPFGRLFLWKGEGASADEIGSARLIGMDLGLTGEIEEVEHGSEPQAFWDAMRDKTQVSWSQDWEQRVKNNDSSAWLYRVEHEKPKLLGNLWGLAARSTSPAKGNAPKIVCEHVSPFTQRDLDTPSIHILDTYRALYILVNDKSNGKAAEFVSALHVVQDVAMLLPSIQDRPVLPDCFVCIGEPPIDVRATFRKWITDPFAAAGGKKEMCVPVAEVIQALKL